MAAMLEAIDDYARPLALVGLTVGTIAIFKLVLHISRAIRSFFLAPLLGLGVNVNDLGSWAVVTGATDGIGKAYAIALAKKGMNVALLSRTTSKLTVTAEEIAAVANVQTKCVTVDFSGGVEIYDAIDQQLEGLDIGILINNVGMGYEYPEYLHQVGDRDHTFNRLLHVNIFPVTFMTTMILPKMVEKRKGAIVNIGSASCFGFPLLTVYAASKAYVDSFSQNLAAEYGDKGIIVQSVYPHHVSTKMSKMRPSFSSPNTEHYVNSVLATLGLESETTGCFPHWLVGSVVHDILPNWLLMKVTRSMALNVRKRALRKKAANAKKE